MLRMTLMATTLLAGAAAAQDADLLVFDYSGFEDGAFHIDYVEKHGASPRFAFFADEEEAFQKLVSGFSADTAHICAGSVTKFIESGMLEPWDTGRIAAWDDLNTNLTGQNMAGAGEVYFLPTDFGSTGIAYNPDLVPEEAVSTLQVFKDPAYAGKITLPDNVDDIFALAYLATGVTDWSQVGDAEFDAAAAWLREVHPNVRTYWIDPAELSQLLASGEVMISWAWNETFPTMVEEGRPVAYARTPKEGSSLWVCGNVNFKDAPGSEDKLYDYVNAVLAPSATQALMDNGFGQANAAAMSGMSQEELIAAGLEPMPEGVPVLAQLPMSQELREKQAEAFEMIKAGF